MLGVARASVPMAVVDAAARAARLQMAYGGLVATGIAMAVAAMIALGILRPVRALVLGANRIGAGELSHRIDVRSNDEIGDLGHALNEMVRRLQRMVGTLDQRNHDMRVVLDNVGQGLVTVDRDGRIADERSRAIDAWFGTPKSGTKLWDLFPAAPPAVRDGLSIGWAQLFDGVLPLELLRQLPGRIKSGDLHYEIGYEPILSASGDLSKCLIVVSDVTATVEAEQTEVEQREQLSLFAAVAKDREGLAEFVKETGALVAYVFDSGENPSTAVLVKRAIHTIRGTAGSSGSRACRRSVTTSRRARPSASSTASRTCSLCPPTATPSRTRGEGSPGARTIPRQLPAGMPRGHAEGRGGARRRHPAAAEPGRAHPRHRDPGARARREAPRAARGADETARGAHGEGRPHGRRGAV